MAGLPVVAALSVLALACATDGVAPPAGADGGPATSEADAAAPVPDADPPPSLAAVTCATPPPPEAPAPPPLPTYSGGDCPTLVAGPNTITSSGDARSFVLVLPTTLDPAERLPVLFLWHYIGGDASSMVNHGQAQQAADDLRLIVVVPEKKGGVILPLAGVDLAWPYMDFVSEARVEKEAVLFDDILACVAAQYPVQEQCISSVGVSAGGLWTAQLIQRRADRLASAIVISGGVGPTGGFGGLADVRPWSGASRPIPVVYGWGGPSDTCGGVDFAAASHNLGDALTRSGNFVVECVHNCGHASPPVDPATGLRVLYRFAREHPFWLPAGRSPWADGAMPEGTPAWCAIGVGNATPRSGPCGDGQACPL